MNILAYVHLRNIYKSTGAGRVARNMVEALVAQNLDTIQILADKTDHTNIIRKVGAPWDELVYQLFLHETSKQQRRWILFDTPPAEAYWDEVELLYCAGEAYVPTKKARSVVLMHDAAFLDRTALRPDAAFYLQQLKWRYLFNKLSRKVDLFHTVSNFSAERIVFHFPSLKNRMRVIHNGVSDFFFAADSSNDRQILDKFRLSGRRYILLPGGLSFRKNADVVLCAWPRIHKLLRDVTLVITSYNDPAYVAKALTFNQDILMTGFVSDEELRALYRAARLVWFPSRYEGFGIPVVEAMACGTPVIASDSSSLPEVVGNAAILIPCLDVAKHIAAIEYLMTDDTAHTNYRALGNQRAVRIHLVKVGFETAIGFHRVNLSATPPLANQSLLQIPDESLSSMVLHNRSFLFLAANTPWVYALAQNLAADRQVTAVRLYDWANYRRMKPKWPEIESRVRRLALTMPQGYAGKLEPLFRPVMRGVIASEQMRLRQKGRAAPFVICPYPYLAPWVRGVPSERLIYYNLDEYPFYEPRRAKQILSLEGELIGRAGLTLCLSVHQVETLGTRNPSHAHRIHHFPLGVVADFLNPEPERAPLPGTIGYVGNLTDRVDWDFVEAVAARMPEARFHVVGRLDEAGVGTTEIAWRKRREVVLALKNVIYEGSVSQYEVREHYWRYAVNWMPYNVTHGFNVASCPTKIMDALGSGRPFVSTDVPEVRIYPQWIDVVSTPEQAVAVLRQFLNGTVARDPRAQTAFAATQTWSVRAKELTDLLTAMGMSTEISCSDNPFQSA